MPKTALTISELNKEPGQRFFSLQRDAINQEARTVSLAFSSEHPVPRWFGNEILDHAPESVSLGRLQDGGAVLVDHDLSDHVGVVESVSIDADRKGRVTVRFGKGARAEEIFQDVIDGIRKHVSVGYRILEAKLETTGDDETDTYRITRWEPYEISLVSVPADPSVGVGRSEQAAKQKPKHEEKTMPKDTETSPAPAVVNTDEARQLELERIRGITTMARKYGIEDKASGDAIDKGMSLTDFRELALDALDKRASAQGADPVTKLDLTQKQVQRYSMFKAIRAAAYGDWKGAEFELECSRAIQDILGKESRGFYVPYDIQTRDMTIGGTNVGGDLKGTDHLSGSFIENLRADAVVGALGAQFLTGLVGDLDIPKKNGSATFTWVTEDGSPTKSDIPTGMLSMAPKTVTGHVYMSRKLIKQSSPSVEAMVMADLQRGAALALDKAALIGSGAGAEPRGIVATTGVNTVTIASAGAPTWAELVDFETKADVADALMGSLHYVTTAAVCGNLKVTKKDAGSGLFLLDGGQANGYSVAKSSQLTANRIIFGNFNDVIVGLWGVLDIYPTLKESTGGLDVYVYQDADVGIRHPNAFSINA